MFDINLELHSNLFFNSNDNGNEESTGFGGLFSEHCSNRKFNQDHRSNCASVGEGWLPFTWFHGSIFNSKSNTQRAAEYEDLGEYLVRCYEKEFEDVTEAVMRLNMNNIVLLIPHIEFRNILQNTMNKMTTVFGWLCQSQFWSVFMAIGSRFW